MERDRRHGDWSTNDDRRRRRQLGDVWRRTADSAAFAERQEEEEQDRRGSIDVAVGVRTVVGGAVSSSASAPQLVADHRGRCRHCRRQSHQTCVHAVSRFIIQPICLIIRNASSSTFQSINQSIKVICHARNVVHMLESEARAVASGRVLMVIEKVGLEASFESIYCAWCSTL